MSDNSSSLPFGYMSSSGLTLSRDEANRIRDEHTQNLLSNKKLILVLDLDNTLLNTCMISKLTPDEKYLLSDDNDESTKTIEINNFFRLVRLRPFVHEFLKQVSTMFELYIYTLSNRVYANRMVQFLDPDNKNNYFGSRVIVKEDIITDPKKKSLDLVLGQERAILILDDRKDVWTPTNSHANLIQVQPYRYFSSSNYYSTYNNNKSLAEMKIDENENIMMKYLDLLKRIHTGFFEDDDEVKVCDRRDVRDVMKKVRFEILTSKGTSRIGRNLCLKTRPLLVSDSTFGGGEKDQGPKERVIVGEKRKRKCSSVDQRWIEHCYELMA